MSTELLSFERFVDLLSDIIMVEPEELTPDTLLVEELGMQSIDVVQLVEQVELELDQDLEGLDLSEVETVEELYWELVAGGDDGGDSVVANMATAASQSEGLPHELAMRRWLPDDPLADVTTLVGMIARRAAVTPDREAFLFQESPDRPGVSVSYRELARQVAQVASVLQTHGVQRGDRVILIMPNSPEFFAAFYGVQHLRAVAVPMFHVPQPDRIARIASHSGAKVLLSLRPFARPLRRRIDAKLGEDGPELVDMATVLTTPVRPGVQLPHPEPEDLAMLQYTSGTTGAAKGVMLTHAALLANMRQAIPQSKTNRDDVYVSWLPVYHDMGLISMTMVPFYLGAKLVLLPVQLKAEAWLRALHEHKGTITAAPDFAYRYVLRTGGDLGRFDLSAMKFALIAAEPIRARTVARFEAELGIPDVVRPGYGLAETCVCVTFYPPELGPIRTDAHGNVVVGQPIPGTELSIRDEEGKALPPGEAGEICLRSPSQTLGYFRNPEATKALFTADGFVRTGDVGTLDEQGFLTIVDRMKNVIIVAGRNLSPRELEQVVDGVEGVRLAMAVGVDQGGDAGEQVHLVVESVEREPSPQLQRSLGRACRMALQEAMGVRAQKIYVVPPSTIPRTYNGKLQYPVMRQRLKETGSPLSS